MSEDLEYLLVKDQLGEILTDAERRRLQAWRDVSRGLPRRGQP